MPLHASEFPIPDLIVEVMAELRTLAMEGDDDAPADEALLALAIERARARTSR